MISDMLPTTDTEQRTEVGGTTTIVRYPRWPGSTIPSSSEMLREEFFQPLRFSPSEAAKILGISANHLDEIVLGKRRITADTTGRLSPLPKPSPRFWMRLQADRDSRRAVKLASGETCA